MLYSLIQLEARCVQIVPPSQSCCATGMLLFKFLSLVDVVFRHAGCAGAVLEDPRWYAGKAHTSVITVFKDLSASEEMNTVKRMNASYLFIFDH